MYNCWSDTSMATLYSIHTSYVILSSYSGWKLFRFVSSGVGLLYAMLQLLLVEAQFRIHTITVNDTVDVFILHTRASSLSCIYPNPSLNFTCIWYYLSLHTYMNIHISVYRGFIEIFQFICKQRCAHPQCYQYTCIWVKTQQYEIIRWKFDLLHSHCILQSS